MVKSGLQRKKPVCEKIFDDVRDLYKAVVGYIGLDGRVGKILHYGTSTLRVNCPYLSKCGGNGWNKKLGKGPKIGLYRLFVLHQILE